MEETWVLLDANTGLHVAWYFWLRVLDEVNRAARYGAPFGLLLLEADVAANAPAKLATDATSYLPATIRSTDLGGLLGPGQVGVLLTHQDSESAEQARDRVLERLARGGCPPAVRWKSQLLTYPNHAAQISYLLTAGWSERNGSVDLQHTA